MSLNNKKKKSYPIKIKKKQNIFLMVKEII